MLTLNKLEDAFDKNGRFIIPGFNPYHCGSTLESMQLHDFLFDEDGNAIFEGDEVSRLIIANNWKPFCDAVAYYYSTILNNVSRGDYPSVYLWR